MEISRIFDLLENIQQYDKENQLCVKRNGKWDEYSTKAYKEYTDFLSYALLQLNIQKGDKIATISSNCPEWNIADLAIMQIGAIHIPIYPNINDNEYEYILDHSEAKIIFISSESNYSKIKNIAAKFPHVIDIFCFENCRGVKHWSELIDSGKQNPALEELEKIKKSILPEDTATIIYTSGTTGYPKGVMLSHTNIISNFKVTAPLHYQNQHSKVISYLPLCHIYERMINYSFQMVGAAIFYVENMGTIAENIQEVKPDIFTSVPRLLEKMYDRIMFKGRNLNYLQRMIFYWSIALGHNFKMNKENGWWYHLQLKIADKLVFTKWREALGGRIFVIVSGGAALQEKLARIYWAAGIRILEGYGLTETSPVIAVNTFEKGDFCFGTVGPPLQGVEVKIAPDGEILAKGPNIMQGYYKNPELTKEVIDDEGWFHTGDLGYMKEGKYVKITGRKKSLFKTSMGKYVSPEVIEDMLRESRFIEQIIVLGENQKFVGALIVPNFQYLQNWSNIKQMNYISNISAINSPAIRKRYQKEIDHYNKLFSPHEQIIKFELIPEEWTIETGELTPTLKLKRDIIEKKYEEYITKIFR